MSSAILMGAVFIAAGTALDEWRARRQRERAIRRAEAEYDAEFDLTAASELLDRHFELLRRVLPPAALLAHPVTTVRSNSLGPAGEARAAVDFAASRLGLVLPPFDVSYTPHLSDRHLGEVCWDGPWEVEWSGTQLIIRPSTDRAPNWRIRLREGLHLEPERLAVVAAHEVAHVALLCREVELLSEAENEQLTDAAVVLAGFGPWMERMAFVVRRQPRKGRSLPCSVSRGNYLHRGAIRYLSERREALRSVGASTSAGSPVAVT